jgi:hypothetical protein
MHACASAGPRPQRLACASQVLPNSYSSGTNTVEIRMCILPPLCSTHVRKRNPAHPFLPVRTGSSITSEPSSVVSRLPERVTPVREGDTCCGFVGAAVCGVEDAPARELVPAGGMELTALEIADGASTGTGTGAADLGRDSLKSSATPNSSFRPSKYG